MHYTGSDWSLFPAGRLLTVSATDKVLGRISSGAGAAEEIAFTDQAQQFCDDTSFNAMLTTLGALPLAGGIMSGNLTVATSTAQISAQGDAGASIQAIRAGANANGPANQIIKARNTVASPQAVQTNDSLGNYQFWGHDGVGYRQGAGLGATIIETTPGSGAFGTRVILSAAPVGSGSISELMRADHSGGMQVSVDLKPLTDNARNLGSGSLRFATVYAATGTINTSDARGKTEVRPLAEAEKRAIRRVMSGVGVFQWLTAVADSGEAARLHCGVTAQSVEAAFAAEGLDARRYALFCEDRVGEGEVRLGVRYDQLFAMAFAALCPS